MHELGNRNIVFSVPKNHEQRSGSTLLNVLNVIEDYIPVGDTEACITAPLGSMSLQLYLLSSTK